MEKKSFEFILLENGMLFDCITSTVNVAVLLRKWGLRERFNHIHETHAKKMVQTKSKKRRKMNLTIWKSNELRLVTGIFLFSIAALMLPASMGHAANIASDPSFEKGTASTKLLDSKSSIDSSVARSGSKSLKLINDGAQKNHNAGQFGTGGVQAGTEYVYSVYVKGNNVKGHGSGGKPLAVVRWLDSSGNKLAKEMYMWAPYGTYGWTPMKIHIEAPPKAAKVDLSFRSWYDCLSGTSNWDDISLAPRNFSYRGSRTGTYQAESANSKSGGLIKSAEENYTGSGYFHATSAGAYLEWNNVSGGSNGGNRILSFRYANEGNMQNWEVFVNGKSQGIAKPIGTGKVNSWASFDWDATLKAGNNTVRVKVQKVPSGDPGRPNIDKLDVYNGGGGGSGDTGSTGGTSGTGSTGGTSGTGSTGGTSGTGSTGGTSGTGSTGGTSGTGSTGGTSGSSTTGQQSYGSAAWPVPGTINAEDYDKGGEGVAYHDTSAANKGGKYRTDGVDIWYSGNPLIKYYTGANTNGEWLEYTVNVANSGTYSLDLHVSTPNSGCKASVKLDGKDLAGTIDVPNTGGWHEWETVMTTVNLSAGKHVLRVAFVRGGFNLNWIDINPIGTNNGGSTASSGGSTASGSANGQQPYSGTPQRLPGTIEAEDFDEGGQGIAYNDKTTGNKGGEYRKDDVDIWRTNGGYYTGANATGEWLEYSVNVAYAGSYTLHLRVATPYSGKKLRVELDGSDVTGAVSVPNTGGWQKWQTIKANARLSAGKHVLRVVFVQGGFNFDWIDIY